ncbi:MOSC domain-containing protein [Nocardioides coralli]|uniref:MOSC domain-containing protein n=1 Tax=Nocardioides coralli TaxID=2872154 RepID=UPI001CA42957|nr:MOSC domain-containing protein [Nocardioides coralli]QZY28885.1 MOSC domain-containing protein [Nocardioides coralli]
MQVARIGLSPIKGSQHVTRRSTSLAASGPVGDRAFCLLDPATDRCLRTVDHPELLRTRASWDGSTLAVALPSGDVLGTPAPSDDRRTVDYWGRAVAVEVVDGPWASAFSDHLGRSVLLAASRPGDVVYGSAVTIVTSASLDQLAADVGAPVDPARFRATFQVDGDVRPFEEVGWVGRTVRVGTAVVRVRQAVPRCRVIDVHPTSGVRDLDLLPVLAQRQQQSVTFGIDADVVSPGHVATGDSVSLVPG